MVKEIKLENIEHKAVRETIGNLMEKFDENEVFLKVADEDVGDGYRVWDKLNELDWRKGFEYKNCAHCGTNYLRKISGKEGLIYNTLLVKK